MPSTRAGIHRLLLFAVVGASAATLLVMPGSVAVVAAPRTPVADSAANIVYVVTDDFSSNLVQYMSNVGELSADGVTFDNFIVTDSQCCPSRASTMTGMYPHNTGVLTNTWPDGGYDKFAQKHLDTSVGPMMSAAGYRTGLIGKYLNGYEPEGTIRRSREDARGYERGFVPPGWDEWHVAGDGYPEFDYTLADAVDEPVATLNEYGHDPEDYLTDVLSDKSTEFLDRAADQDQPFFLTVAPFATHSRIGARGVKGDSLFPAAPRDRPATSGSAPADWPGPEFADGDCGPIAGGCTSVPFPDPGDAAAFNQVPKNAHPWMRSKPIRGSQLGRLRENYLDRIRMAQAVDDLVGVLRADLERLDLADSTYIVFTSDNGYHLGEHGLLRGKNSAFDTDIRVPLIVVPPGGASPETVPAIVQNTDFLPTFLDIAGVTKPERRTDGESLLPMITSPGDLVPGWREGALVQYSEGTGRGDPDQDSTGTPPPYFALRTADYTYVSYATKAAVPRNRDAEFYDLVGDPNATVNSYSGLSDAQKRALFHAVERYSTCSEGSCAAAGRRAPGIATGATAAGPRDGGRSPTG